MFFLAKSCHETEKVSRKWQSRDRRYEQIADRRQRWETAMGDQTSIRRLRWEGNASFFILAKIPLRVSQVLRGRPKFWESGKDGGEPCVNLFLLPLRGNLDCGS